MVGFGCVGVCFVVFCCVAVDCWVCGLLGILFVCSGVRRLVICMNNCDLMWCGLIFWLYGALLV